MSWLQISVHTTKNHTDTAEDCLFSAGCQTITLTDAADQPILEPGPDETPIWNNVVITGLFSSDNDQKVLLDQIEQCLAGIDASYEAQVLEDQNWTRAWMDHFHAMQFGQRLWVCPLHLDPPDPDAINMRLDPGLAFGTGTHPTTSLCLSWLDRNIPADVDKHTTLLDYGCGSGILAIAACMLGIEQADGVDIDPQALTATHDNAEVNLVGEKIKTYLPNDYQKQHPDTLYDIVVANILSGPLGDLAAMLAGHTKTGGDIALSGILREQADGLLEIYGEFFTMDEPAFEEDWVLLHGVRK